MWGLDFTKYSPVWCQPTPIKPWLINQKSLPILRDNASYLLELERIQKSRVSKDSVFTVEHLKQLNLNKTEISLDETLKALGVVSLGSMPGPFVSQEFHQNFIQQSHLMLATEKFTGPGTTYFGSSRHALANNVQLKGIGRNSVVSDFEYAHSCGILNAFDAFKAMASGLIINQRTKLKELECHGLFTYDHFHTDGMPNILLIRAADSYRLAHCWPSSLRPEEKELLKDHLFQFFQTQDPQAILTQILENYIHAYSVGILHRSPSLDNLLIDGRWIDSESLDFSISIETYPHFYQLFISDPQMEKQFEIGKTILDIHIESGNFLFYSSWIHQLKYAALAHTLFLEGLYSISIDTQTIFSKLIKKYIAGDADFWLHLSDRFISNHETHLLSLSQTSLRTFQESPCQIQQYPLRGCFYDTILKGWILHFSMGDDPHEKCVNTIKKLFRFHLPRHKSWEESFQDFHHLSQAMSELKI